MRATGYACGPVIPIDVPFANPMIRLTAPLLASLLAPLTTSSDDYTWPQWDGPDRSNVSRETAWSSEGVEQDLWRKEVGLGYSTVVVADGRLFTMGYDKDTGLDTIWCFEPVTGEELWTHSYESEIWNRAHEGGTVNTPSIDGDVLYSLNREGNLFCLDVKTGEVIWHTFLKPEENPHELEYPVWGFSASPLVLDDRIYLNCGRILAVDKKTGEVQWASKDYGHAYGTPTAFEFDGKPMIVTLNAQGVGVISREDGSEVYFHEFKGENRGVNAATPIVIDDAVFVSSGTIPAGALLAFGEGELVPVWQNREMVNSFSGCVRMGDHLYGFDGQILKCVNFEGETVWQERGIGNGAVSGAGDSVLAMSADGELIVLKANPEDFEEQSRAKIFEEGRYWTKPILVNGIIYCRSSKGGLVARDHRASSN